jgi:hypothetical protein
MTVKVSARTPCWEINLLPEIKADIASSGTPFWRDVYKE